MATILKSDLVDEALRELGVVTPNNPAEPDDVQACFNRLERMIAEYSNALTVLGYVAGTDPSAESGLLPQYEQSIIYMLARRCLSVFDLPLKDPLAADSDDAKELIDAACMVVPELARSELQPRGAGRRNSWIFGDPFYVNGELDGNST